ncbi:MAG: hypothetical protein QW625_02705 [Candidatus Nanoarchaeia archaeon]
MIVPLCTVRENNRKGKADEVLFCPVSDEHQLKEFITTIRKLEGYGTIDYLFLYKKGFPINPKSELFDGLSAIHAEENIPLGSSGVFFVGSYALFQEGYKVIVIADIDAIPSSKKILSILLRRAYELQKVAVPLNNPKENIVPAKTYVTNHWGAFHRSVFEKVGFYTPYMWRGGEDYDFMLRLKEAGLLLLLEEIFVYHPRAGYTIFHKMAEKKKFYPYVAGLLKAFLFHSERNLLAGLKFIIWYVFYAFYGDVFSDSDMAMTLSKCNRFTTEYHFTDLTTKIEIKKIKEKAVFPSSFLDKISKEVRLLLSLLLSKRALIYTDEITLKISRAELLFGVVRGLLLLPFRFIQAFFCLMQWSRERKKVIYPVTTKNADEAIAIYEKLIKEKKL